MRQFRKNFNKNGAAPFFPVKAKPKSAPSWIMFRYLGRQYLLFFVFCLFGFAFLFLIGDLLNYLQDFLDAKAETSQVVAFFFYRQTTHLIHVLPMSVLLAVSYVLNSLARNHEITAVRASGVSMFEFCLPVWGIAVLAAFTLFWVNERVVPDHLDAAERIENSIQAGEVERKNENQKVLLAFRNHQQNRYWFFENFDRHGAQEGVSIKQIDPDSNTIAWEIRAAKAEYKDGAWLFLDGHRFDYEPDDTLPAETKKFARYSTENLSEEPRDIYVHLSPVEKMNLREIIQFLRGEEGAAAGTLRIFRTLVWHRVTLPLACIMAALLGVGMSTGGVRAGALRGFASAIGLMALYHITSQALLVMGNYSLLPPFVAGALPTLAFTGYGFWLVYQKR